MCCMYKTIILSPAHVFDWRAGDRVRRRRYDIIFLLWTYRVPTREECKSSNIINTGRVRVGETETREH